MTEPLERELDRWNKAALFKIRTWAVIQSRHRAGETIQSLADDYGVPHQWVRAVLYPENDLDARYGRPSDRTKTMRERAEQAEAELAKVRAEGAALVAAVQQVVTNIRAWQHDDEQGYDAAMELLGLIDADLSAVVARLAGGPPPK